MSKEDFIKNIQALHAYQKKVNQLEDILGVDVIEGFIGSIIDCYGELILKSVIHCDIDNLPDAVFDKFWNTILNNGDNPKAVEDLYKELKVL